MSDGTQDSDKREHARGPIELKVEYKRLNTFFSDYTKNISKGGTFIKTNKPLDVGTAFVFKLFVPSMNQAIRLRGSVQWIVTEDQVEAGEAAESGMGIRFVYNDTAEKLGVEHQVERLMVDSLGQRIYARLMGRSRDGDGSDS